LTVALSQSPLIPAQAGIQIERRKTDNLILGPRFRVWSRGIGKGLERGEVAEALEPCSIVIADEAEKEDVALVMGSEQPVRSAALRLAADGVNDAAIEALDHAVSLRVIGLGQAMVDTVFGAELIEGMPAGRPIVRLVLHVDGEAVGELTAIVSKDGVNRMWEVGEEAFEEAGRGLGIALGMDFDIDIAGGAIDGDEGIALAFLQGG
jgi:hypothetical protein